MRELVFASTNTGKCKEISTMLARYIDKLYLQSELNISTIEETGLSFIENAILKARHVSQDTDLPVISDDSGLIVDALSGQPGIYSARYAGANATSAENINKLLMNMNGITNRKARFYSVIVLLEYQNDPMPKIFDGTLEGEISLTLKSGNGFGYDTIFYLPTHNCSVSELAIEQKNSISHRGVAINKLLKYLQSESYGTRD